MKKLCLIFGGIVLVGTFAFAFFLWDYARIKSWGVDVESVEWLPTQASNITFISSDINRVAEFDIDQDSLLQWCDSIGKSLAAVAEDQTATIWRVNPFLDRFGVTKNGSFNHSSLVDEEFDRHSKRFTTGDKFFEDRWANGGGYVIGYDVSEGRGYYQFSHH
ncbi:hypothetical protein FEM03_09135 [Phragmitibacter flavus]|uniref:Uncharacterized protein n=1 Tax=Phragmitibacter flavus TaxID=2576071 RepID=A0A5R8KFL9_9BACT|nr:hypothetical protein [Phragmitibacter flavus]TLD71066.1 hypothetical protein FEM03_09135 [Phragmitibacter flavus]